MICVTLFIHSYTKSNTNNSACYLIPFNNLRGGGVAPATCLAWCPLKPPQVWIEDGLVKLQGTLLSVGYGEAHDQFDRVRNFPQ